MSLFKPLRNILPQVFKDYKVHKVSDDTIMIDVLAEQIAVIQEAGKIEIQSEYGVETFDNLELASEKIQKIIDDIEYNS